MKIKITMRYNITSVRMAINKKTTKITSVVEYVEKREPLYTIGEIINCYSHYGKQYGSSSKD